MEQIPSCTGVILCGGRNIRFGGRDKAFAEIGRVPIVERLLALFSAVFSETIIVTNTPEAYLMIDALVVTDLFPLGSPLVGIHAGLMYAKSPYVFVAACDIPFLKPELLRAVAGQIDGKSDVVVPETAAGRQPLCAVYGKQCLTPLQRILSNVPPRADSGRAPGERRLDRGLKVAALFEQVRVKAVPETILRRADPELISFFNVNTPQEYDLACRMCSDGAGATGVFQ